MGTCRSCGARLFEGADFCARCHTPVVPSEEELRGAAVEIEAAGGRWRAPRKALEAWRPPERHTAPPPPVVTSHWARSVLTFGPAGRIGLTLAVLGVVAWTFVYSGSPGSGFVFAVLSGWVLKDIWKKARVRKSR